MRTTAAGTDTNESPQEEEEGRIHQNQLETNNNDNENDEAAAKQLAEHEERWRKKMVLAVILFTVIVAVAIAVVVFLPGTNSSTDRVANSIQSPRSPAFTQIPTISPSVTTSTGSSATPTAFPSSSPPTAAPTPIALGCRGDRFDNQGNAEGNNRLYTGQFVCSDDDDQRYHFGLAPITGNLIWYDTFTDHTKTYYTNDYFQVGESVGYCGQNCSRVVLDYSFSMTIEGTFQIHRIEGITIDNTAADSSATTATASATTGGMSTVDKEDYLLIQEALYWELPSLYNISTVYENCLKTHDCPYMHLHRDGVMVLAWLDFQLSEWWDGWMEKNIRRCYDFPTTDVL